MKQNIKEIWKDILGYEGYYQVSNMGRVKSLDRDIIYSNGRITKTKGKILNGFIKPKGYISVDLYKNNKRAKFYIHRLVAFAFIPNPDGKEQINHLDENPENNCVNNLEWCTCKENLNYGNHNKNLSNSSINNPSKSRRILQFDFEGNFIKEFPSAKEVERQLNLFATGIIRCCRGRYGVKQCGGYKWKYKDWDGE